MNKSEIKKICSECARAYGGVWINGHIATFSPGRCDVCQKQRTVASAYHWGLDGLKLLR